MDRTSKIIFAMIAAGLWANVVATAIRPAMAQMPSELVGIAHDLHTLYNGTCTNGKLC